MSEHRRPAAASAGRCIATTRELLGHPSVVGHEGPFLDHLEALLAAAGVTTARLDGAVIGNADGPGGVVLSAHVDRHGLVLTGAGEARYAAHVVAARHGERPRPTERATATVCTRVADEPVVAYDAVTGAVLGRATVPHRCDLDHGPGFRIDDFAELPAGTPVGFDTRCSMDDDGVVAGQIDNTVSVAVAIDALRDGWPGPVVLTTEEEVGWSWRHLATALDRVDLRGRMLVVLDTSPFDDDGPARSGAVVLRTRDATATFEDATVARLRSVCSGLGAPVIVKDAVLRQEAEAGGRPVRLGRTELGRLVAETDGRLNGATLQVPTWAYHTNEESTTEVALEQLVAVISALAEGPPAPR